MVGFFFLFIGGFCEFISRFVCLEDGGNVWVVIKILSSVIFFVYYYDNNKLVVCYIDFVIECLG